MERKKGGSEGPGDAPQSPVPEGDIGKKDSCQLRGSVHYVNHQIRNQKANLRVVESS